VRRRDAGRSFISAVRAERGSAAQSTRANNVIGGHVVFDVSQPVVGGAEGLDANDSPGHGGGPSLKHALPSFRRKLEPIEQRLAPPRGDGSLAA